LHAWPFWHVKLLRRIINKLKHFTSAHLCHKEYVNNHCDLFLISETLKNNKQYDEQQLVGVTSKSAMQPAKHFILLHVVPKLMHSTVYFGRHKNCDCGAASDLGGQRV